MSAQIINLTAVLNTRRAMADRAPAEATTAARPMPAYCDPHNERRGAKYEATKGLPLTEIATRMRQDVKAAVAAGHLPQGLKVSIRVNHHTAIDLRVTGLPVDFPILAEDAAAHLIDHPDDRHEYSFTSGDYRSTRYTELMDRLRAIHGAYNRDNSDSQSDYFDVRYYGQAEIDSDTRRAHEAAQIAAITGKKAQSLPRFKIFTGNPDSFTNGAPLWNGLGGKGLLWEHAAGEGAYLINRAYDAAPPSPIFTQDAPTGAPLTETKIMTDIAEIQPNAPQPALVPESRRMDFLPHLFGNRFTRAEGLVYDVMAELCPAYSGGFWEFYTLPHGAGFMAPSMTGTLKLTWAENWFDGEGTAETAGIICTLHALAQFAPDTYYLLRDYVATRPDAATIYAAID